MKYKKKRMWKAYIFFILFFVSFFSLPVVYTKLFVETKTNGATKIIENEEKLRNIGYSINDISYILKDKNLLDYTLKNEYDSKLIEYAKLENFNSEKLEDYYKYENNNKEASKENIIKLVNMGIDYEYSDKLMNLIEQKYFVKENLQRYMTYNNESLEVTVRNVNCNLDIPFYTNLRKSNLDDGVLVLVNKHYYLDKDYTPSLVSIDYNYGSGMLTSEAYNAFKKLSDAARSEGLYILSRSPYRSYATQYSVYNQYKNNKGQDWADRWSARPGHSEHQTGLAVDVKTYTTNELNDFTYTREYQWMKQNAHLYGFILRYPEGKEYITGYGAESWHYRYVGVTAAQIMYSENLTFEEYYAYYVKKEA